MNIEMWRASARISPKHTPEDSRKGVPHLNPKEMRRAILQMLLESKRKGRQGMMTESIIKQLGEDVDEADVQYCLRYLSERGYIDPAVGDDRILVAVLTTHGESIARDDYTPPSLTIQYTITNSNIGAINQGIIQDLKITINALPDEDYKEIKEALQVMAEAVTNSNGLAVDVQEEVLKQLTFLGEQVSEPPAKRNLTLARVAISLVPNLIGHAADVTGIWESDLVQPLLQGLGRP